MTRNRAAVSHRLRDRPFGRRPSTLIDERPTLFAYSRHASLCVRSAAPLPTATTSVGTISSTGIGRGATECALTPISHFLVPLPRHSFVCLSLRGGQKLHMTIGRRFRVGFGSGAPFQT